jgi:hypothetical protein
MSVTVHVTETRSGYVSFATQDEADEWMEFPDFDAVKWTDYLDSDFTVVTP